MILQPLLSSPLQPLLRDPLDPMQGTGFSPLSPQVAAAKFAAATAPTTVAAIPTRAGPTATLGASNNTPPYDYKRFWISGDGTNDGGGQTTNPRLNTVAFIYNFANWALVYGGGVTNNMSDGSTALFWYAGGEYTGSPPMIGIRTNSRYLSVPTSANGEMSLIVDGATVVPGVKYTAGNQNATWDFGSNALRKIVLVGGTDTWISEVLIESTATIAPYDFTADRPVTISFIGDSYLGHTNIAAGGLSFMDMQARMIGALSITANHRGGTGYYSDNGGGAAWRGQSVERAGRLTEAKSTIMAVELGINDPWPTNTPLAIETALPRYRAGNPNAILVIMGPWAPNQTNSTNPAGSEIAKMDKIISVAATLAGPWIVLDNLRGNWITSNGKARPTLRGPWQTGDGRVGAPTGAGNGDTWVNSDGVHPTVPVGITGLAQVWATETRGALAAF